MTKKNPETSEFCRSCERMEERKYEKSWIVTHSLTNILSGGFRLFCRVKMEGMESFIGDIFWILAPLFEN